VPPLYLPSWIFCISFPYFASPIWLYLTSVRGTSLIPFGNPCFGNLNHFSSLPSQIALRGFFRQRLSLPEEQQDFFWRHEGICYFSQSSRIEKTSLCLFFFNGVLSFPSLHKTKRGSRQLPSELNPAFSFFFFFLRLKDRPLLDSFESRRARVSALPPAPIHFFFCFLSAKFSCFETRVPPFPPRMWVHRSEIVSFLPLTVFDLPTQLNLPWFHFFTKESHLFRKFKMALPPRP